MKKPQKKSFLPALNAVLPDWFTGKDVREIQGPVYIPPAGKAGSYRKELAADIARKAKDPFTQRDIQSAVIAGADIVPLMGEDVGIKETGEYWKKGDYINAAASGLGTVLGVVPVVGDVGGKLVKEGGKKLAKGLGEAVEHLPNVEKPISSVVDPVAPQGLGGPRIKAYHGSPHSFEEFDISKIGTGEGAQAYGHGLYFAENEGVAKSYRDTLASKKKWGELEKSVDELLPLMGADTPKLQGVMKPYVTQDLDRMLDALDEAGGGLDAAKAIVAGKKYEPQFQDAIAQKLTNIHAARKGHMYEVDIAADPEAFLDWDKPLSEQPASVRARMEASVGAHPQVMRDLEATSPQDVMRQISHQTGGEIHMGLGDVFGGTRDLAGGAYSVPFTNEPAVSELLRNAGIPGIKYFDQGSRGNVDTNEIRGTISMLETAVRKNPQDEYLAGQLASAKQKLRQAEAGGTRNYVVFDPKLISIVKKYGLAGALAAGLISQDQAEAMERQGLGDEAEAAPAPAPPRSPVAALDERVMDEAYTTRQSPRDVLKRMFGLQ